MLVIFGWRSKIAEELRGLLDSDYEGEIIRGTFDCYPLENKRAYTLDQMKYFFCSGYLIGKKLHDQTTEEFKATAEVNYLNVVGACNAIFEVNSKARICVMGSESGISGSYDEWYGMVKNALHHYVETKKLLPDQQLVAVAPGIIGDAGMTTRRADLDVLEARKEAHPKKRFVSSLEVAHLVRFLLYEDQGYITNTVIRMNGGGHTSR